MLYLFKRKPQPTPGTGDMAFMPGFSLPATGFVGPASMVARQLFPLAVAPQMYYSQSLVQDGLAGIPTGSMGQSALENQEDVYGGGVA